MKNKTKRSKNDGGLENPIKINWRTNADGFEYINRTLTTEGKSLSEKERELWFTEGWEKRLDEMRRRHRAAGLADDQFVTSKHSKSLAAALA